MALTIDQCVDEIFKTQKNEGNAPAWRTMKTRFYDKSLSVRSKMSLLKKFGYKEVCPATYEKAEPKPSPVKKKTRKKKK